MLETVIGELIVSFISSLAVIAYKFPKTFEAINIILLFFIFTAIIIIFSFNYGIYYLTFNSPDEIKKTLVDIFESKQISTLYIVIIIFFSFYMGFLSNLHKIINYFDKKDNDRPQNPETKKD